MNNRKFRVLSWIIIATILVTVLVQAYWNWRNYEESRKYLISEAQNALDNAVEQYYTDLAKVQYVKINDGQTSWKQKTMTPFSDTCASDTMIRKTFQLGREADNIHHLKINLDSLTGSMETSMVVVSSVSDSNLIAPYERRFVKLASKLAMSLEADSLNYERLDSLIAQELIRKGLNVVFKLKKYTSKQPDPDDLVIYANSAYFPPGTEVGLAIEPGLFTILKKGISGVLVSIISALVIIFVLIYLYRFIRHQKSLDLMKNDLINNITHEFKTPIATVSTALEAIEKFNTKQDLAKTTKYLHLSNTQLSKLNAMVEKLLETATLEENELVLHREKVDLNNLVNDVVDRYLHTEGKTIKWSAGEPLFVRVDPFHFEHVISNLIDNAIKYGGHEITVGLSTENNTTHLSIEDNGGHIPKNELNRIFDKFYRISRGNVHDVKGHGIGLYYAKVIVEKHNGSLTVVSNNGRTTFDIALKHE